MVAETELDFKPFDFTFALPKQKYDSMDLLRLWRRVTSGHLFWPHSLIWSLNHAARML